MNKKESQLLSPVMSGVCGERSCKSSVTDRPASPFSYGTFSPPPFSEETLALLRQHFWCDFSDVIPIMAWEENLDPQTD